MQSRQMVVMNLFAGSNGDADIGNIFVDTLGEGDGGINREISMEVYTLLYVKLDSQWEFAV